MQGGHARGGVALGAPEISSLADLGGASSVLYSMDPRDALALGLAALIPMTPLALTMFPAQKIFDVTFKVLV